jgi:hypothetical protein
VNISGSTTPATAKSPLFGVKIPESRVWDISIVSRLSHSSTVNRDYFQPGIHEWAAGRALQILRGYEFQPSNSYHNMPSSFDGWGSNGKARYF